MSEMNGRIKPVITRREQFCSQCNRKFPAGTGMETRTYLDVGGNGWFTWHICMVCQAVLYETDCEDYDGTLYELSAVNHDPDYWEKRRLEIEEGTELHALWEAIQLAEARFKKEETPCQTN